MRRIAVFVLIGLAFGGCGESASEKNARALRESQRATRELARSTRAAAAAEIKERIAALEHDDASRYLKAIRRAYADGRPAPPKLELHRREIARWRGYLRKIPNEGR